MDEWRPPRTTRRSATGWSPPRWPASPRCCNTPSQLASTGSADDLDPRPPSPAGAVQELAFFVAAPAASETYQLTTGLTRMRAALLLVTLELPALARCLQKPET